MTNRRLGCMLPPARQLWPTAPTIWTPSFLSSLFTPSFSLSLVWFSCLSLNTKEDDERGSEASKREQLRGKERENEIHSSCLFGVVVWSVSLHPAPRAKSPINRKPQFTICFWHAPVQHVQACEGLKARQQIFGHAWWHFVLTQICCRSKLRRKCILAFFFI